MTSEPDINTLSLINVSIAKLYTAIFGSENSYLLPRYQRPYSWETKQLEDLWNDLTFAVEQNNGLPYLLGSIYLAKVKRSDIPLHANESVVSDQAFLASLADEQEHYFVIDGQQRLTTLFLLLHSFGDAEISGDLFHGPYPKLSLGRNDYAYFKGVVQKQDVKPDTKSNKRLKNAYDFFSTKLKEYHSRDDLKTFIRNNLQFVKVTVADNFELANTLFVSQTDRGKRLTNLEKLKSTLMFYTQKFEDAGSSVAKIDNLFGNIFINIESLCSSKLYSKPENAEADILKIMHVFLMKDDFYRIFHDNLLTENEKDNRIEIWHEAGEDRVYDAISRVFRENLSKERSNIELLVAMLIKMLGEINEYYSFLAAYSLNECSHQLSDLYEGRVWYPLRQLYSILGLSVFSKALLVDLHRLSRTTGINAFGQDYKISKSSELLKIRPFDDIDRIKGSYHKLSAITGTGSDGLQLSKDMKPFWEYSAIRDFIIDYYKKTLSRISAYQSYNEKDFSAFNLIEENELSIWKNNKRPIGSFFWDGESIDDIVRHIRDFSYWYKKDYLIRDLDYNNYKYVLYEYERLTQPYSNEELTRIFDYDIDEDDSVDIQREHIFAQSPENYDALKDLWLSTTNENYDDWIWKIGNIALLEHTINIGGAGNKKVWDKAEHYLKSHFKGTQALANIILDLKQVITDSGIQNDNVALLAYKILLEIREMELLAFTFYRFA